MNKLNEHFDASTGTATLHTLPFERTRWGPVKHGIADQSKILYLDGKPLVLWAVAEIEVVDIKHRGNWRRRPRIKFRPLLNSDARMGQKLYALKACPIKSKQPRRPL